MIAKVMIPAIAVLATIAVCQPTPLVQNQNAAPGVFIPADALKSPEESARQNNAQLHLNSAPNDQTLPPAVNVNLSNQPQPNPLPQNSVVQPNQQLVQQLGLNQQQWPQQPVNQQQWYLQPAINQNLQQQPIVNQQWVPNQQLQEQQRWVQQPGVNQQQVQPQLLQNQLSQVLVAQPLIQNPQQNQQQLYLPSQNGVSNQQAILVSQPNQQLLVNQPNNQPLLVASSSQPNQNLLIQNGQPGMVGTNAIIGQVLSAPVSGGVEKPVQSNIYELVPINNQHIANNPNNGNAYLVPVQQVPSTSLIMNQG